MNQFFFFFASTKEFSGDNFEGTHEKIEEVTMETSPVSDHLITSHLKRISARNHWSLLSSSWIKIKKKYFNDIVIASF